MAELDYDRWSELSDREALGEPLSESDQTFLAQFAAFDPTAQAEREFLDSLGSLEPLEDELGNRALAKAAVERLLGEGRAKRRGRSATLWIGAGALAAAAAVTLTVRTHAPGRSSIVAESVVELGAAHARSAGLPLAKGAHVPAGSTVEAVGGTVCVAVEPTIHVCLADGAQVRLARVGVADRRVDLLKGRVAAALFPLPHDRGERFSIVSNGVWSTAVGTAFSVELLANGGVETIVHEGKVAVGPDGSTNVVTAHKIGLSQAGRVTITALASHARTETSEWEALGSIAGRSVESGPLPSAHPVQAPVAAVEPPSAPAPAAEPEPVAPRRTTRKYSGNSTPHPAAPDAVTTAPNEANETAAEVLSTAHQALREQRWNDAAVAYERIISAFPSSAESHTVLVPLARLELERLKQPDLALQHAGAYLAAGGTLAVEAEMVRIQAYRALGNTEEEARAIDAFLANHPGSLEVQKLKARRAVLGGE